MATQPVSPYRTLQRRCKAAGLPANRAAAELERLLAEHSATAETTTRSEPRQESVRVSGGPNAVNGAINGDAQSVTTDVNSEESGCMMGLWPDGFAGISSQGIFGALPGWVNANLPAGHTSQVYNAGIITSPQF
jgi:hypothetical protein